MRITLRKMMIASASVTALLWTMTTTAPAQAPVPFIETFEAPQLGVHWSFVARKGTAVVQDDFKVQGIYGVKTDMADLTLNVGVGGDAATKTNVWCQLYAKPTLHANDAVVTRPTADVSAAFYVQSNGAVMVWSDGGPWTQQGTVLTGGWLAFAVHSDYVNRAWNLYVSDDGIYGTRFSKLNNNPLDFNASFTAEAQEKGLTGMTIAGVASLDAVALGKGVRTPAAAGSQLLVEALTLAPVAPGASTPINLMTARYAGSDGRKIQVGKALGDDLLVWMKAGDAVTVRDTAYHTFTYNGAIWETTLPTTLEYDILPGMGAWIQRSGGGDLVMFMDYTSLTYPGAQDPQVTVYGTATVHGFTFLTWGKDVPSLQLGGTEGNRGGFQDVAGLKDNLYLLVDGQPRRLFWDQTLSLWRDSRTGGAPALQHLTPGAKFWYYRGSASGNNNWFLKDAL